MGYTATVFPSSAVKKNANLNLFSRPIPGYKYECELSKKDLVEKFQKAATSFDVSKPIHAFRSMAVTPLILMVVLPFVGWT